MFSSTEETAHIDWHDMMTECPFSALNAVWGVSSYTPYYPHRDPKNVDYVPVPDPVNDPNWYMGELPMLAHTKHEPLTTEMTTASPQHECTQSPVTCQAEPAIESSSSPDIEARSPDSQIWSRLPTPVVLRVLESSPLPTAPVVVRPATAIESRKLDNVFFDADGHMGQVTLIGDAAPLPRKPHIPHVDDFESIAYMPPRLTSSVEGQCQTNAAKPGPFVSANMMRERSAEQQRFLKQVASVGTLYEAWGLPIEDAYVDVITGFHRIGSPTKRFCLGFGRMCSSMTITLANWSPAHTKMTVYVDEYCALTETVRDAQIMKLVKDCLWALFNHGSPLQLTLYDGLARDLPEDKYGAHPIKPILMLTSLARAWGSECEYINCRP